MAAPVIELFQLGPHGSYTYGGITVINRLAFDLHVGEYLAMNGKKFHICGIEHTVDGMRVYGRLVSEDDMIAAMQEQHSPPM